MCSGVSDSSNKFPAQKVIKREKKFRQNSAAGGDNTICPRSIDPFYVISYYIEWVTKSWTHSRSYDKYINILSLIFSIINEWQSAE